MSSESTAEKEHPPSQTVIDKETGEKWRLCVGAAVLNSRGQLLVGERINTPNAWQCPQGGVDDAWKDRAKESIAEAAARELYEEMGLQEGTHVLIETLEEDSAVAPVRYRTNGTSNWLTKAGFAGQELHWALFRCVDARGDVDPELMCNLGGQGGESAEFGKVEWRTMEEVIEGIWEKKRETYLALQQQLQSYIPKWQRQRESLDFTGKWSRESTTGLAKALEGRGLTQDEAEKEANKPYIQSWKRESDDQPCHWIVTTFNVDGVTPRRELEYKLGVWEERYEGKSVTFGSSAENGTTLTRRTCFVAEPDATHIPMAHVTITDGPKGVEESRRYLKDEKLLLRRTLWPKDAPDSPLISTEIFIKS